MTSLIASVAGGVLRLLPLEFFIKTMRRMIALRLKSVEPKRAMKQILLLDNFLYVEASRVAVAYDGGRHVKHRLTGYVDYFADLAASMGGPYLDLGCGNGELSYAIAQRVEQPVVGVDIAEYRIEATKRHPARDNLRFVLGDATKIDLGERFRTVILSNVLEHIEDRVGLLRKIREIYQPEQILIRVPVFDRDWRVPLKRELGVEWRLDITHEIEYVWDVFVEEVEAAGFRIERSERRWGEIWAVLRPVDR